MESMLVAREKGENIIIYDDFLKTFMGSGVFLIWIKNLVDNILLLLYNQVQEPLNGEKSSESIITVCGSNWYKSVHILQNQ